MKKYKRFFVFSLIAFFLATSSVFARVMTPDELGEEAINLKNDNVNYIYVIGNYAFTDKHKLTTQDIMLAARSIKAENAGYTDKDDIYGKMNIQKIIPKIENFEIKGWQNDNNAVGSEKLLDKFDIRYIDYEFKAEKSEAKISIDLSSDEFSTYNNILKEKLGFDATKSYENGILTYENGKVSGFLLQNTEITLSEEDKEKFNNPKFFFAYVLEVPNANENTKITTSGMGRSGTISISDFDVKVGTEKTPGIVVLVPLTQEDISKNSTLTINVDLDGEGIEYESTPYTLDLSGLTFQGESNYNVDLDSITDEEKEILAKWGYHEELNRNLKLEDGKLTGTLVEQELTSDIVYGSDKKKGYFYHFTFVLPKDIDASKVKIEELSSEEGNEVTKTFVKTEYDSNGNLTLFPRIEPGTTCDENCKLYFRIDLDGDENQYYPTYFTLDYSGVTLIKSSFFTLEGIENDDVKNYTDGDWYDTTNGYSVSVTKSDEEPNKYNITGLLPIFDDSGSDYTSSFDTQKTLYYLGLLLKLNSDDKLNNEQEQNITVKFFHDDEEDNQAIKVFGSDFSSTNELYILKALTEVAQDGSTIPDEQKVFNITVDLDGDATEYEPYTVTVDWSGLMLQSESIGNFGNYSVIQKEELDENAEENKQLAEYNFNFDADKEVSVKNENDPENGNVKKGLTGKIKEQDLKNGTFSEDKGYFVPIKVEFPGSNIEGLDKYKNTWTIILNTEDGTTKEYIPTEKEYEQGWVMVLFKIYENGKNNDKKIKYQIDFDGTPTDGKEGGYDFLPQEYTIDYSELEFIKQQKITYTYKDSTGTNNTETATVYQGDTIDKDLSDKNTKYRSFDGWYNTDGTKVDKVPSSDDNQINLTAHWKINVDEFITEVVNDLNSDETTYSDDFGGKLDLRKNESNKNEIIINVEKPNVSLTELAETSIPGSIAYILDKGEIEDITLTVGQQNVTFNNKYTSSSDKEYKDSSKRNLLSESGKTLKEEIVKGAKEAFDTELSGKESTATLDQIEYIDKSFEIKIGNTDKTVTLVDSNGNEITDENEKKYTFKFDSDFVVVNPSNDFGATDINEVLTKDYTSVYLDGDVEISEPISIDKSNMEVTIEPLDKNDSEPISGALAIALGINNELSEEKEIDTTISTTGDVDYVIDVKSGNVNLKDLKLSGGTNAELKVENGATVKVDNVDVSDIEKKDFTEDQAEYNAGIIVAGGKLEATNLVNSDENYDTPAIRVLEDSKDTSSVNAKGTYITNRYYAVTRNFGKSDTYVTTEDISYYTNENSSKIYCITFFDHFSRSVGYVYPMVKWYHYGEQISTDDVKKFREDWEKENQELIKDYEFKGWFGEKISIGSVPTEGKIEKFEDEVLVDHKTYYAAYSKKTS